MRCFTIFVYCFFKEQKLVTKFTITESAIIFLEHHFDHSRPLAELAAKWHSAASAYHPARKWGVSLPPFILTSMLFLNPIKSPVKSTVRQESPASLAVSSADRP